MIFQSALTFQDHPATSSNYQFKWGLPVTLRVYQPPPGSTSHHQGLPATLRVYQQPSGSTSHLQGLPATSRVYQ